MHISISSFWNHGDSKKKDFLSVSVTLWLGKVLRDLFQTSAYREYKERE